MENAVKAYLVLRNAILRSDREAASTPVSCTARPFRKPAQSMNSVGGRSHDNARCESMWARMKEERFYSRLDSRKFPAAQLKELVWRYFSAIGITTGPFHQRRTSSYGEETALLPIPYSNLRRNEGKFLAHFVSTSIDNFNLYSRSCKNRKESWEKFL